MVLVRSWVQILFSQNVTFYSFNKYLLSVLIDRKVKWALKNKGTAGEGERSPAPPGGSPLWDARPGAALRTHSTRLLLRSQL